MMTMTSVTKPFHQKQGYGTQLLTHVLQQFPSVFFVSIGWIKPTGWDAERMVIKQGFESLCDVPQFWLQDSLIHNYGCPYCDPNWCACDARIAYYLEKK